MIHSGGVDGQLLWSLCVLGSVCGKEATTICKYVESLHNRQTLYANSSLLPATFFTPHSQLEAQFILLHCISEAVCISVYALVTCGVIILQIASNCISF